MDYTKRLVQLRTEIGISQATLAKALNTTQQMINRYEHEIHKIPIERLIAIADYYNVSIDWITGRSNSREVVDPVKPN